MFNFTHGNKRCTKSNKKLIQVVAQVGVEHPEFFATANRMVYEKDRWSARLARKLRVKEMYGVPSNAWQGPESLFDRLNSDGTRAYVWHNAERYQHWANLRSLRKHGMGTKEYGRHLLEGAFSDCQPIPFPEVLQRRESQRPARKRHTNNWKSWLNKLAVMALSIVIIGVLLVVLLALPL